MARILVVEDDPAQRFLFVTLIRRIGYDALGASDADAAFDTLGSGIPIHAILADMSMPGLHGLAFLSALREHYPHIPQIAMSVSAAKDWKLESLPALQFLQKPFTRDDIANALQYALGQHGGTFA